MSKIALLLQKDFRVIYRDGFMSLIFVLPAIIALAARIGAGIVPIEHIELYVAPMVVMASGTVLGSILGFSLIEEREQNTWLLLRVLPLSEPQLFGYLAGATGVLTLLMLLLGFAVYGLLPAEPALFASLVLASTPFTGLFMLMLGATTKNKIEGMAIGKVLGSVGWVPLLAFVLPAPWQVLLWWNPLYWLYLGLLKAFAGSERMSELAIYWPGYPTWTFVVIPFVLSVAGFVVLARIYRRRAS
jgi:fluoroquinolone transport system permease protein